MKLMERVFIKKENIKSSLINTKNKIVGFFSYLWDKIYIKDTLIEINQYIKGKVDIINGIKGLDFEDKLTIQQVIRKYIDFNKEKWYILF